MIDDSHSPHLGAHGLENPVTESVFVRYRLQGGDELAFRPFNLDEDSEENALVVLVPRKKDGSQFIEVLDSGDPVVAEFDLGAYDSSITSRFPFERAAIQSLFAESCSFFSDGHCHPA